METSQPTNAKNENAKGENEHREGPVARTIEQQTAKIPSDVFLWAAGAAILGSMALQIMGARRGPFYFLQRRRASGATFVGMWAPTILLLGIYNKIVKVAGSDKESR